MTDYITTKEAADFLDYTRANITHLIRSGKLKAVKRGRAWLIKKEELEFFMPQFQEGEELEEPTFLT